MSTIPGLDAAQRTYDAQTPDRPRDRPFVEHNSKAKLRAIDNSRAVRAFIKTIDKTIAKFLVEDVSEEGQGVIEARVTVDHSESLDFAYGTAAGKFELIAQILRRAEREAAKSKKK